MDRNAQPRGRQQHALENRLVVELDRVRRYRELALRQLFVYRAHDFFLELSHTLKRQCAGYPHEHLPEDMTAGGTDADALDRDDARHLLRCATDLLGQAFWGSIE